MMKKADWQIFFPQFIAVTGLLAFCSFVVYLFFFGSELGVEKYDKRPELSFAPQPIANVGINHWETPHGSCGPDAFYDEYVVGKPLSEVEEYYKQEMLKYCLPDRGGVLSDMQCNDDGHMKFCRYTSCYLNDELPSLYETFSVYIFPVSETTTKVLQSQDISYQLKHEPQRKCGE